MERISGIKKEPSDQDVEKEIEKVIGDLMIYSLLKALNPDDEED